MWKSSFWPRVKVIRFLQGSAISLRWGSFGCDVMDSKNGYQLIQYGRRGKTVKFVCRIGKGAERPPMFLMGAGWKCFYKGKSMLAGETAKPILLAKMWG